MRRSRKHKWNESYSPKLAEHSRVKHEILSKYISKYLNIVCQNRRIEKFNLTLIDGFAGGGRYSNGEPGSPFIMLENVDAACIEINLNRNKKVSIESQYYFIEKDPLNYTELAKNLTRSKYSKKINDSIITRKGDFNDHVVEIVECIKKNNPKNGGGVIFFLDQDGYSAVSVEVLNYIKKQLPQSEIIINISISWLVDFINNKDNFKNKIIDMGLEGYIDTSEIFRLSEDITDNRYIIESKLSDSLRRAVGYKYFRPFFIEPIDNHRGYWLLHLSSHFRAHNAMSEVTWDMGNNMRHYGGVGTRIFDLSYKPSDEGKFAVARDEL
ncbi:MAG TPA: three-Cys-motif partner protein TcmP [Gammaproteobacteria bacterium]